MTSDLAGYTLVKYRRWNAILPRYVTIEQNSDLAARIWCLRVLTA